MKTIRIVIILIIILLASFNISLAKPEMQITSDKQIIQVDEEINLKIELSNTQIASLTLEIYWDTAKLEYLSGPQNSNYSNNRLLYTWVSDNVENYQTLDIGNFTFKGLKNGLANVIVTGEFFNSKGESVTIDNSNLELQIGNMESAINLDNNESLSSDPSNTNLSALRIDFEGLSPSFHKDIKEYYFVSNASLNNLNVTAIPENPNSTVIISGNTNLHLGRNTITISILSEDKTKEDFYKIYLTKTSNIEAANANLENLAVQQAMLNPEFDSNITKYYVEVENEVSKIDILAIPQNQKASVTIMGDETINVGDNKIEVTVFAEDGVTNKKYEITVHRRNTEEEIAYDQEQQLQAEKLAAILETQENENEIDNSNVKNVEQPEGESKKDSNWIIIAVIVLLEGIVIGFIVYKVTNKNKGS